MILSILDRFDLWLETSLGAKGRECVFNLVSRPQSSTVTGPSG
jgi:hypothetical protein